MRTCVIFSILFIFSSDLLYSQDDKGTPKVAQLESLKEIRHAKIIEINKQYLNALDRLKIRLTKKGNLDAAIAVKTEIDKINDEMKNFSKLSTEKAVAEDEGRFPDSEDYKMAYSNYKLGTEHARPIKCRFKIKSASKGKNGNLYLRFRTDKSPAHGTDNAIYIIENDSDNVLHTIHGSAIDKRHKVKLDKLKISNIVNISIIVRGGDAVILKAHKHYDGHNIGIPSIKLTIE